MDGIADLGFVENIKKQLKELKIKSVNFQGQTLCETLIKHRWYNPFPKVRYTERPDAAAASLLEGSVLILCDNSPSVMILPTSIFDFFQETDDFCFPPLTGSYLRIVRFCVYIFSIYLTPVWYFLLGKMDRLPDYLQFLALSQEAGVPVFWQLLIIEFALDGMRLASLNTPDVLGSALSIVGGLILGDFAVNAGWFSPDVILYTAFVAIANFTQTSFELGYAIKFMRIIILVLTHFLGGFGILLGTLIMLFLVVTNKSIQGSRSYLYPLIPFNGHALLGLIFRVKHKNNGTAAT
jgi:stage V sporulation protein AF